MFIYIDAASRLSENLIQQSLHAHAQRDVFAHTPPTHTQQQQPQDYIEVITKLRLYWE